MLTINNMLKEIKYKLENVQRRETRINDKTENSLKVEYVG